VKKSESGGLNATHAAISAQLHLNGYPTNRQVANMLKWCHQRQHKKRRGTWRGYGQSSGRSLL